MYKIIFITSYWCIYLATSFAQEKQDTLRLAMDAIYNRPFLQLGKTPVALGGYVEANTQYLGTDGVTEGLSFQMRRMTLFVSSVITPRIRFLSEIELEEGGREINIEFASLDLEWHPLLNLRGGILMNPIGAFNQNHDGPNWEFVDRPIFATQLLPATWSNAGFGLHGKHYTTQWVFAYETYLSNGLDNRIIDNQEGKTFLPAAKDNTQRFEESFNGIPLLTTKLAVRHRKIGELGISHMGGVYNKFEEEGLKLDKKRRMDAVAVDCNTTLPRSNTFLTAEWVWIFVDVPSTYTQQYGSRQRGGFLDIVQPVFRKPLLGFEKSVINFALRLEYVDWNVGTFRETGDNIGEELISLMPAISWRPSSTTVVRLNYRYQWQRDLLGNPPARTAGILFGIASYF